MLTPAQRDLEVLIHHAQSGLDTVFIELREVAAKEDSREQRIQLWNALKAYLLGHATLVAEIVRVLDIPNKGPPR